MLLTTKLLVPPPSDDLVLRPRLIRKLSDGRRLTLLSAPAGSGKTTLLVEWIGREHPAVAWVSLDPQDNAPGRFLSHLVASFLKLRPELASRVGAPGDPAASRGTAALEALVNALTDLDEPLTLVLDDYHFIEEEAVHRIVGSLVVYQPPKLHVVLSSRSDPPLPLSRLRVRRQLREIRGTDLRFTPEEASDLLERLLGTSLPAADVETLYSRTEGWAAGLQLAGLSLRGVDDPAPSIAKFKGDHRHVVDYLTDEVLAGLDAELRDFLLRTSILERLSAPLCEALTGAGTAQERLELIEKSNLFLVPLDEHRTWYRYHHLFADLLRSRLERQLPPAEVARLHLAAGRWHESAQLSEAAIRHALAAARSPDAPTRDAAEEIVAGQLEAHGHRLFNLGRRFEVEAWLEALPEHRILERPRLALLNANVLVINQRRAEAVRFLDAVGAVAEEGTALHGEILVARASLAARNGEMDAVVRDIHQAFERLPESDVDNRCHGALLLGIAERWLGNDEVALRHLGEAKALGARAGNVLTAVSACAAAGRTLLSQGRLRDAEARCRDAVEAFRRQGWDRFPFMVLLLANLGEILWERGDPAAREVLERAAGAVEKEKSPRSELRREGLETARLLLCLVTGEDNAPRSARPTAVPPESRILPLLEPLAHLEARLCLRRGDVAGVRAWLDEEGVTTDDAARPWNHGACLLLARVLLAEGRPEEALDVLAELAASVQRYGRQRTAIEVYVVQALVRQRQGAGARARDALRCALALAAPEGAVRAFRELGAPLAALLRSLAAEFPDFCRRILESLPEPAAVENPLLVEPLSQREQEVLQLLYSGQSNKEISERLFLSVNTVKTHIRNIYGKLGATSRSQAFVRVRELGLL